jgi:outer membrane protein assembly factor BamE (lipoprotein component of BamABCDE complex)
MTNDQVVALLGRPLYTHEFWRSHPAYEAWGDEVWSYTSDGAAPWGDWAWLSREVIFRDGRVVQRVNWTYHD